MNEKIVEVTLDLYQKSGDLYTLNQGNETTLHITLLENGIPYTVKHGIRPALIGVRRDGKKVAQTYNISVSDNIVTVRLRRAFLSSPGVIKLELWLIDISEFEEEKDIDILSDKKPEGYAVSTFPFSSVVHESMLEQNIPDDEYDYPLIAVYTVKEDDIPSASRETPGIVQIGDNIEVDANGLISVSVADKVEINNPKPVSSGAVYAEIGNIEILLAAL